MIAGVLEWLASGISGVAAASKAEILVVLALILAALYARRLMAMGQLAGRGMTIVAAVAVVLAIGIGAGALDVDLALLGEAFGELVAALKGVVPA